MREAAGRTYFNIVDGYVALGQEASLSSPNTARYLSVKGPDGAATLNVKYGGLPSIEVSPFKGPLRQQWGTLTFATQTARVTLNSLWTGTFQPIPPGSHTILAPDYSHAMISTSSHAAAAPGLIGNDVWFPIGLSGSMQNSSRYIHIGHLSEGCVTVYQTEQWSALYRYLISHRVPGSGGKRVGTLMVRRG